MAEHGVLGFEVSQLSANKQHNKSTELTVSAAECKTAKYYCWCNSKKNTSKTNGQ